MASSWAKLLDVGIGEGVHRVIGFRKEGDLLIEARGTLSSFNPRDLAVKGLGICSWHEDSLHADAYVESLVLLGSPEQTKEDEVVCEENEVEDGRGEDEIESTEGAETRVVAGQHNQSEEAKKG